jgi:hypothetical protein
MRISASTHHNQRRSFFAVGTGVGAGVGSSVDAGVVAGMGSGAAFSVPQWVQKRVSAPSSLPQLMQNAFMPTSRA